jgi:hypothetical protein
MKKLMVGTKVGCFTVWVSWRLDIVVTCIGKNENYSWELTGTKANWVKAGNRIYSEQLVKELGT